MASTTSATTSPAIAVSGKRSQRSVNTVPLVAPSVVLLFLWMIVPLAMTLWFSFQYYNLLDPLTSGFAGFDNYYWLLTDPSLWTAMANTLFLVFWVLVITVGLGTLLAVLFDQDFYGRGVARLLAIAPFFVMPTVSALIWKNMLMHPVNGLFAFFSRSLGFPAIDFFGSFPLTSVIIIVAWQWLPFALLILLTAIQSLDNEQKEAARMDGAGPFSMFFFIILPHLGRAISVVIMIETIFLLSVFAEIYVTTSGGPGLASTNLAFLIYLKALREFDVGGASAGGVIAVVLANIVAIFLVRSIAKNIAD
jgi:sorbitol/mannitol transport system permease protein